MSDYLEDHIAGLRAQGCICNEFTKPAPGCPLHGVTEYPPLPGQPEYGPPPFTLKATDPCAPAAIMAWMSGAAVIGVAGAKIHGALDIWMAFVEFQKKNPALVHVPD